MTSGKIASMMTLRPATPEDYETILAIQRHAYELKEVPLYGENLPPLQETPETLAQEAADGKQILVGTVNGIVVASMRVQRRPDGELYWGRLSVDPSLQGQGLGQAMVRGVENFFPEVKTFVLDCGVKSEENNHIYSKLGYVATGETFQVPNGPLVRVMRKRRP